MLAHLKTSLLPRINAWQHFQRWELVGSTLCSLQVSLCPFQSFSLWLNSTRELFWMISLLSPLFAESSVLLPIYDAACNKAIVWTQLFRKEATSNLTTNGTSTTTSTEIVATLQIQHYVLIIDMLLFQTHSTIGKMTRDLSIVPRVLSFKIITKELSRKGRGPHQ